VKQLCDLLMAAANHKMKHFTEYFGSQTISLDTVFHIITVG